MSGYQYTYFEDTSYLNHLPQKVQDAGRAMLRAGDDLRDLLRANTTLTGEEKAALADTWEPGAGEEFRR